LTARTSRVARRARSEWAIHLVLLLPAASTVFVLYYLVANSLKPASEFYASSIALPKSVSLEALDSALHEGGMLLSLRNSVILASVSLVIVVLVGSGAAYAISRLRLPFKATIFIALLVPMSISPLIVMIPLFEQLSELDLINTFIGGIALYVGLRLAFTVYVLEGIFRELPDELFEAARVDGASELRIFLRVLLPLALPGLAAVSIMNVLEVWNDLLVGLLFLSDSDTVPITANVVAFQGKFSADPQRVFAGLLIAALPMLLVYLGLQRYFIRGLVSGAFK
jgi:raffinose/stachyose/melibiose transport system permease protein